MTDLDDYIQALNADTLATAESEGATAVETFTRSCVDRLEIAGVTDNTICAYFNRGNVEVHAMGLNHEIDSMDLFLTDFDHTMVDRTLNRRDIELRLRRLVRFVDSARNGLADELDDTSEIHDLAQDVAHRSGKDTSIRLFLLTNARVRSDVARQIISSRFPVAGREAALDVWDATRWQRLDESGTLAEPIRVEFDPPIAALSAENTDLDYHVLLAVVPGQILAALYGEYGTRLLELNVRSFLQTRGAVNKGIRETILTQPGRFLAYNNGITATASQVEKSIDGSISVLHDLQIVNGGQTTASLYHAAARDKADLSGIQVQAKINIIKPENIADIVPKISQYSNTQNRVSAVDLRANDAFHVKVEQITRTLWAPATAESGGQNTIWFYERARGQYADALNRESTRARQRRFKVLHPTRQKFTKTDLAKYVNSWDGLPHIVSRGAEKNFTEFMGRVRSQILVPDQSWCEQLIAKAILFKETERIVSAHKFGGYRANIVTYAIAKLADVTGRRVNLNKIWLNQSLEEDLRTALTELSVLVHRSITDPPSRYTNIGEWCKQPACWDEVQRVRADVRLKASRGSRAERYSSAPDETQIKQVMLVSAEEWFTIRDWANQNNRLELWQRGIAETLGKYAQSGRQPSPKQAKHGLRILDEASASGYVGR